MLNLKMTMSKLYHNETGRVIPTICEEITRFRRAKVHLSLPASDASATLYILAKPGRRNDNPLHVQINGKTLQDLLPEEPDFYKWYHIHLVPGTLRAGINTIILHADSTVMNGWSIAMEAGHESPRSAVSDDAGETWRSDRMGYLNVLRGEYCVRIRLDEGRDPSPPPMIWENKSHPRADSFRQAIPDKIKRLPKGIDQVRALATWLSMSWEHTGSGRASIYTPWEPETILNWGAAQKGHNQQRPIVMCVHYAVAFVSACQVLDIPARSAILMGTPNGSNGHFVAEVWLEPWKKWVMVDPNCDAILFNQDEPLSIPEIQTLGEDLSPYTVWGPGTVFQRTFPHMRAFIQDNFLKGICFRHRSIWPRSDYISNPAFSPPGHGSVSYCETDLVWPESCRDSGFGMFLNFAPPSYFEQSPG